MQRARDEETAEGGAGAGPADGAGDRDGARSVLDPDRRRCAELEEELARARATIARHEAFIHEQHLQLQRASDALQLVVRSRSWRLTAPLRNAAAPAKRVVGAARALARRLALATVAPATHGPERRAVLFLSGCPGDAKRYRCDHQAERLAALGVTSGIALHGPTDLEAALAGYAYFVLHRVAHGPDVAAFLRGARRAGKPVVFDTDDWVFDLDAEPFVAALADMGLADRNLYREGLTRYRKTLSACDAALVTTEPLAARAREVVAEVRVTPNVASREMVELAAAARARRAVLVERRRAAGEVVLGYFSGTPTHRRDFAEAVPAIAAAMEASPLVRLMLVGHIEVPAALRPFSGRIRHVPLVPWQQLPDLMAEVDLNLAPLEPGNGFTECKSSIKFLEAALAGVPTVATPVPDFGRVIESGRNGWLAATPGEWREVLLRATGSPRLLDEVGARALEDALAHHTTLAHQGEFFADLSVAARPEVARRPLTVNWILRAPIAGTGGGYWTIFRLANALARAGHRVRVYVEPIAHLERKSVAAIGRFLDSSFGPLSVEVVVGHDAIAPADATIATNWPTAFTVARHQASLFKFYFIQDFEPEFYAKDDPLYAEAEATYALPLAHVTIGRSLARRISGLGGKPCASIDFAVDADVFRVTTPPDERPGPPRVLFFARPGLPRRGFELGMAALRRLAAARPEVRIACFGATDAELGSPDFPIENLGVLSHAELARAMNEAHVLLCFSLSANISWVPLQGMACGCAVVEADVSGVREMVAGGETCLLAEPEPDAVAERLLALTGDDALRRRIAAAAVAAMCEQSFAGSARQFEEILLRRCFVRLETDALA